MRSLQCRTDLLLPRSVVIAVLKDMVQDIKPGFRITIDSLEQIQEALEDYTLVSLDKCRQTAYNCPRLTPKSKYIKATISVRDEINGTLFE